MTVAAAGTMAVVVQLRRSRSCLALTALLVLCWLPACESGSEPATERPGAGDDPPGPASTAPTTSTSTDQPDDGPVVIELRLERQAIDGTDEFIDLVQATLTDPRGWIQAGFEFRFADDAPYTIVLADPAEVDALCAPYDTGGQYSCQIGPTVALNADRWREATPTWTGTLEDYRRMLINHEVGHLLGRHHARPACEDGGPAAVMFQQSSGLDGCRPNPWPLPWEIACAARHDEPLAPGYEEDAEATCGPADP